MGHLRAPGASAAQRSGFAFAAPESTPAPAESHRTPGAAQQSSAPSPTSSAPATASAAAKPHPGASSARERGLPQLFPAASSPGKSSTAARLLHNAACTIRTADAPERAASPSAAAAETTRISTAALEDQKI